MSELDHPFLMSLVTAFQDDYSLYMLLGVCSGGELYAVMSKAEGRRLSQRSVRFYTACILDGLAYMHSKNICHRDLKAENVMLDKDGYCVIIDFGFGKLLETSCLRHSLYQDFLIILTPSKFTSFICISQTLTLAKKVDHKTFTLCGTPFYLAPEALLSKGKEWTPLLYLFTPYILLTYIPIMTTSLCHHVGYDKGVDYWAMGVILYEMLIGCEPFYAMDEMGLYRQICEFNYYIPDFVKDGAANLINRIFKKAKKRIGCLVGGVRDIRDHKFFSKTDWDRLAKKTVADVPWVPGSEELEFFPDDDDYDRITSDASGSDIVRVTVNAEFAGFGYYVENRFPVEDTLRLSGKVTSTDVVKADEQSGCCVIS